ncbi:hypothetical protein [Pontiella agarivorans]|uniref:Uncharacterized protein n=1 Tax=Pontiella agarivorans TaxID=3038953 RepID=A0ABU5N1L5_9BACT|nr:hypothetical protein [Pontiella agarivorans]MDZ8120344.1 hypothetical protein [Pontiella agarivorans]
MKTVEIICGNCGADALLTREPIYEGFSKIGEKLICSACGFEFPSEADVPFKHKKTEPAIFTDADRPETVKIFEEDENAALCRYCANYIVNPFTQFCSVHKKEVESTDTCPQFEKAQAKKASDDLF